MAYIPITEADVQEMLKRIGVKSIDDLFADIPNSIRLKTKLDLGKPLSQCEVERQAKEFSQTNKITLSFLGAGVYNHYVPSIIDNISSRSEFLTSYTPYQPEVSQGTLTAIFEFQTYISLLSGCDIANASMYDGATALVEALLMSRAHNGKNRFIVSSVLHPNYKTVLDTYAKFAELSIEYADVVNGVTDFDNLISEDVSAVVVQNPNFLGCIEDLSEIANKAHSKSALFITVVNEALSLALLNPPGECGADIVAIEAQSFGNYVSFGGPLLGVIAAKNEFLRKMPGRLAGKTKDSNGVDCFALTLQTREQHIRREKATSNICTNEGLLALRAVMYLSLLGPKLKDLAKLNHSNAVYLKNELSKIGILPAFDKVFFNEFVVKIPNSKKFIEHMKSKNVDVGLDIEKYFPECKDCLLVCVTETISTAEIDLLISALKNFKEMQ